MRFKRIAPLIAGALALACCENSSDIAPRPGGAISTNVPTIPPSGVLLGGLLASSAGRSLEDEDKAFMNQRTSQALETGLTNKPAKWQNPKSGDQAQVVPTRTYQQPDGTYCREYTQTIFVKDQPQSAHGTACRQSDGTWAATG